MPFVREAQFTEAHLDLATSLANFYLDRLSQNLIYHHKGHTFGEVIPAMREICVEQGIEGPEFYQSMVLATLHDIGFFETYFGHEVAGANLARDGFGKAALLTPLQGWCDLETALIVSHPLRSASSDLSKRMKDADHAYLGRLSSDESIVRIIDFRRETLLFPEAMLHEKAKDDKWWWQLEEDYVGKSGLWHTDAARKLYDSGRQATLNLIKQINSMY